MAGRRRPAAEGSLQLTAEKQQGCIQDRFDCAMRAAPPPIPGCRIGIAVSGGPDSLVLAILAHQWCADRDCRAHAILIDHRLRAQSSLEIAAAVSTLSSAGLSHSIIRWTGSKGITALQEQARIARYRLLAREAHRLGILTVLIGHHHDDQIETVAMRAQRPGTALGLSGMTRKRLIDQTLFVRPLIECSKSELIEEAERRKLTFARDPSNLSIKYERGRLRLEGIDEPARIVRLGRRTGRRRAYEGQRVARELATRLVTTPNAGLRLDLETVRSLPIDLLIGMLKKCLTTTRGVTTSPALRSAEQLARTIRSNRPFRTTLGGCVVERIDNILRICREPGRIADVQAITDLQPIMWDDRFSFEPSRHARALALRKIGTHPGNTSFHHLEHGAMPGLWSGMQLVEPLSLNTRSPFGILRYCPSRCLIEPPFAL